ncbi:MAG: hypothetical protein U1F23_00230 [Lysobacterales bacterium]
MAEEAGFFSELKRRHVWRVLIAYMVTAWVLLQLASIVLPAFGAPGWVLKALIAVIVILFPIALLLAWAFEITPEGVRRTEPAHSADARETSDSRAIGRKLNTGIIVALAIAVALLLGNQFLWHRGMRTGPTAAPAAAGVGKATPGAGASTSAQPAAAPATPATAMESPVPAATAAIPEKSVAVLPFANEGAKGEQFFSDGLSEDLITALSQFGGLKVISRNSAFQFRDSKDTAATIGRLLGVAHLLEGSVQRAGDEVRITATLVNASDGTVVWTKRYDKPYKDLFALQDAITAAVADALKAKLLTAPGAVVQSDRPPSGNLAAYTAYQQGIAYDAVGTEGSHHKAIDAFHDAIRLDPKYAAAYAALAGAWNSLAVAFLTDSIKIAQAQADAHKALNIALKLNPDFAPAHVARAYLLQTDLDWTGAKAEYRRVLKLAPNDSAAQFGLGIVLASLGQNARAVELTRQVLAVNPRDASLYNSLSEYLTALGQLDAARAAIATGITLQPGAARFHEQTAVINVLRGDAKSALAAAQAEPPGPWHEIAMALALQIGPDRAAADAALAKFVKNNSTGGPYQIAEVYALRRNPDVMFQWLDRAFTARDPGINFLLSDPLILRYRHDPRFAAFCKKVGLPTATDAVAMK